MSGLTSYQKRVIRYTAVVLGVLAFYIFLVYTYFQFESFGSGRSTVGLDEAAWYVFLNPTGLGDASTKLFPATLPGKLIGVVFALSGLSLIGLFVGKVTDMFNEYREYRRLGYYGTDLEDHVIIIGWDRFSKRIARQLMLSGVDVAVITDVKEEVDLIYEEFGDENVFVLYTDYEKYGQLALANIDSAQQVFLNRRADTDTLITLLNFHNHFEELDLKYVVRVNNDDLLEAFEIEDIRVEAVSTFDVASALIASHIFEPDVAAFGKDLIASAADTDDYEIQQFLVTDANPWAGTSFGELYWELYEDHRILPIGLGKRDEGERSLVELPGDDVTVEVGDYVIMIVSGDSATVAEETFGVEEGGYF
jgi:voltage-gated potassium channel